MTDSKFSKIIDYEALKAQYGENEPSSQNPFSHTDDALSFNAQESTQKPGLKGSRLRSYAFAVLTRKEYSKAELIEKLALYAENRQEVLELVDELSNQHYQSDQRVAEIVLSSQKRKGKGPNRIKLALKTKKIDSQLIQEELKETNWAEQAYQLKVKKFGTNVEKDPKIKAKQIRFLMYRGFEMDTIIQAINRKFDEDELG
ncbi:RecX family transcriptional regulator [Acinetobacter sp. ANC 4558]|uniref:regulatory protein RecX n=1 Tax=Acinetobacter sp. ANC 4558 TaxID=1977876 RepID=UPI000A33CA53|nr:regulatory protein RecX [Acinetobacter sp. ANC 4558]OTG82517.1 RecX family transcriptional regulator [Acinetobacter sp. ANC 4558]